MDFVLRRDTGASSIMMHTSLAWVYQLHLEKPRSVVQCACGDPLLQRYRERLAHSLEDAEDAC